MKIGNVLLENNVFLAPMAGVTDLVFRIICKEYGCGLVYSEMVSAKGILHNNKNTQSMLEVSEKERPAVIQLFGSDPQILGQMAKEAEKFADIIDINMGCPAPKIVKNGEGSALMKNPKLIGEIVKSVSSAVLKPVTVKFRKGFDNSCINAPEIAEIAEENGAAAVAVHGRTREEYYSGSADWDIIKEVKKRVSIPVIGNGDVTSPETAKELFDKTGCDAIMIGRAAEGNPWIFKRTIHYIKTGELLPEPTIEEKLLLALKHLDMLVEYKGEYIGVREMRRHLGKYVKGIPHSAEARFYINKAETKDEMKEFVEKLLSKNGRFNN